jgi:hypothetical protein
VSFMVYSMWVGAGGGLMLILWRRTSQILRKPAIQDPLKAGVRAACEVVRERHPDTWSDWLGPSEAGRPSIKLESSSKEPTRLLRLKSSMEHPIYVRSSDLGPGHEQPNPAAAQNSSQRKRLRK